VRQIGENGEDMANCVDVANFFLTLSASDDGELLSNLKVQKLAYYAQGFSLALSDRPLFSEGIEAWDHGPVVPALYHRFKRFGSGAIEIPNDFRADEVFSNDECSLLNDVYLSYGQYTAWKLRNLTHDEAPWRDAYARGSGSPITLESMKTYFRENLIEPNQA